MILIPVILCGGAGSRLWPVSREQHPKPFIRLADGQNLFSVAHNPKHTFVRGNIGDTGPAASLLKNHQPRSN